MFGWYNDELENNYTHQLQGAKYYLFLTIQNNSGVKIHCPLGTDYGEENVMNLQNVRQRQVMFPKERINTHNEECKG